MQQQIHPESHYVIFRDTSSGAMFKVLSTCESDQTIEWEDGNRYPLVNIEVSSASHPAYTGIRRQAASEGKVARFKARFGERSLKGH
ncbi:type B 50S ribosomal protein L31 [Marinobacterium arenosum]|uniref:type B 50S ribosomal protein L31 n=1 Tax=Marinobacterium arenosum TaxID=2862496 RepID=UPI001C943465|nr:type B 50S ribosomal protein L31 [Marinobacterium arenosum]MBY4678039.1 type B 50S ribosomal protein L31 [Marinobacterium arenosum]